MSTSKTSSRTVLTLTATAGLLAGLLVAALMTSSEPEAKASMVVSRDAFTVMTANIREGEDGLFVLDGRTGNLVVYRNDGRDELEALGATNVSRFFQASRDIDNDNDNRRSR